MALKPELWADMQTPVARVPQRHVRAWTLNGWWHTFSYKECHSLVEYAVQADAADLASKTAHVSWLLLHGECARKEAKWLQPLQALQPELGATVAIAQTRNWFPYWIKRVWLLVAAESSSSSPS
jgi:hypothetical protein